MGSRGPVPKRDDQRRRRNKPADGQATTSAPGPGIVAPPPAYEGWHPVARRWFESLATSGQSVFYQPSDWATAYAVAESMSRELRPQVVGTVDGEPVYAEVPLKGASLAAYLKAMTGLLVTEGDRRRSRLELQRAGQGDEDEDAAVARLDEYRRRVQSG